MTDPSVEEIVAWLERRLDDGMNPVYLPPAFARDLIADWRKRGEALKAAENRLREYNGTWFDAALSAQQQPG